MTDHTMEEKRNHAVLVGLHASSLSQECLCPIAFYYFFIFS